MTDPFRAIAQTVLYEGYALYPYRPSALKNQQRWNFGTLYPPAYTEVAAGFEPAALVLECLIASGPEPRPEMQLCFLAGEGELEERTATFTATAACDWDEIAATATVAMTPLAPGCWRLNVHCANRSWLAPGADRAAALRRALHSAHLRCWLEHGTFISAQARPPELAAAVAACRCVGVYPVLLDDRHLLASPIILQDRPRLAPESRVPYFDSTEMDEMLALRVLTLTEAEKAELRATGGRVRGILQRTEAESEAQLPLLHGAIRDWGPYAAPPDTARVAGILLRAGDRVRLRPRSGGDVFDLALAGKAARIQAIEQDLDGHFHFAVVVEDDPGADLGNLRQPGHRFFFSAQEIEPCPES